VCLPTINGYAYYRYSCAAFWRLTLSSPAALKLLPSSGESGGQARWRTHSHPRYARTVQNWTGRPLGGLSNQELLDGVIELLDAVTEYYTAVQAIIPIAASSEVIFTQFYERLVRRAGDPPAATFLLGFDSAPILAEKSLYDLATWTRTHDDLTAVLLATPSTRAGELLHRELSPEWDQWRARVPDTLGPLRAHHLQPRLPQPDTGRRPGAAVRRAALLPRRLRRPHERHRPARAAGPLRRPP